MACTAWCGDAFCQDTNETLDTIFARKSVRMYDQSRDVTDAQLDTLVRAGMAAPTAMDRRPWEFVVVTERAGLDKLAQALEYGKMLFTAKAAIVVCGNMEQTIPGKAREFWIQDCSAATENILLAAESMGLGAVWLGVYPDPERAARVRGILGIPETVIPLNVISIGYPQGGEQPKNKYDPAKIHKNKW
jgi:nitroreductase